MIRKLHLVLRITAICTHNCCICQQKGNHRNQSLEVEAFRRFVPKILEFVSSRNLKLEALISGIGDLVFCPELRDHLAICLNELDACPVMLQTSGFHTDSECETLLSVQEMVWKRHQDMPRIPTSCSIATSLYDREESRERFSRLIGLDFPGFHASFIHDPGLDWAGTWRERDEFYRLIKEAGFVQFFEGLPEGAKPSSELEARFNLRRGYRRHCSRGETLLWTGGRYITPVGAAAEWQEKFVWADVNTELPPDTLLLTITEDGLLAPCFQSQLGFYDIRDTKLDLASAVDRLGRIMRESHELIAETSEYREMRVWKCSICPLMFDDQEKKAALDNTP